MAKRNMPRRRFVSLLCALPGMAALISACGDTTPEASKTLALNSNEVAGSRTTPPAETSMMNGPASNPQNKTARPANLPNRGPAPEWKNETWINSEPLRLADLRGKVVAVEFWTFGCINCQHVIPSLRDLYADFADKGFTIVGMHAPEFDYEKKLDNVKEAVKQDGIKYPVAIDNDFETWNKFRVRAWPTLFLLDKQGQIRYNYIGEGAYAETRAAVAALLAE